MRSGSVNFIDGDDIPSLTFEITCRKSSCWDETIQMRGLRNSCTDEDNLKKHITRVHSQRHIK